jgi:DNA modification methylase
MAIDNSHKKYAERYKIHQYWSRKPWYIVRNYIEKYSDINDVILDPFVGGGVTAFEAIALERNVIAYDINPVSILLTKVICEKDIDLWSFNQFFLKFMQKIPDNVRDLYKTKCRNCHKEISFVNTIWDSNQITSLYISCNNCGFKGNVQSTEEDRAKLKEIEKIKIENWYPNNCDLPKNSDVDYVHELYTKRNLIVLSEIYRLICDIDEENPFKNLLLLMFISTSTRTIKSIFVNHHRLSNNLNPAGVWGEKRFWVPKQFVENNVIYYFNERYEKIIKAKNETSALLNNKRTNCTLDVSPAQDLNEIKSNSVDYVFTDPPYAGAVKYLDLSTVWNCWLNAKPMKDYEIILSEDKNLDSYINQIGISLKEMFRTLKNGKHLSICFHFSNLQIWNEILQLLNSLGYEFDNVEIFEPMKKSHNQYTQEGGVETDVIITLKKVSSKNIQKQREIKLSDIVFSMIASMKIPGVSLKTAQFYDKIVVDMTKIILSENYRVVVDIKDLNSLSVFLEGLGIQRKIEYEMEYTGKTREIIKWDINNVKCVQHP